MDTNQLVSSLLSTPGLQRQFIDAWRRRAFVLLLAPGQVQEVAEVLSRPKIAKKYRIVRADRDALLDLLRAEALLLSEERDDDYLLGCAAAGGVNYLVTGDEDLLAIGRYRDVAIVDARTFLTVLSS